MYSFTKALHSPHEVFSSDSDEDSHTHRRSDRNESLLELFEARIDEPKGQFELKEA
jgi:hypothetical protein